MTELIYDVRSLVHELEINKNLVEQMSLSKTLNFKTPLLRLFDNHPKYYRLRTYFKLQKVTSNHFVVSKYRARNLRCELSAFGRKVAFVASNRTIIFFSDESMFIFPSKCADTANTDNTKQAVSSYMTTFVTIGLFTYLCLKTIQAAESGCVLENFNNFPTGRTWRLWRWPTSSFLCFSLESCKN